jgi:hypothetical protein
MIIGEEGNIGKLVGGAKLEGRFGDGRNMTTCH